MAGSVDATMHASHELILTGGALGLVSIVLGLLSRRFGAPLLVVFLIIGMLAGEDGPGAIRFDDFAASYLIGSVALAVILFEGGLKTERSTLRATFWPALSLATVGVAITAGITGLAIHFLLGAPIEDGLLIGAAMAPTDAAAVSSLLRHARVAVPDRVFALLEVESGLNDPMSVFLMLLLVERALHPGGVSVLGGAMLFAREMGGGAVMGLGGGYAMLLLLRQLRLEPALFPIFALTGMLALFGVSQVAGTSGFLAVFAAGIIVGTHEHRAHRDVVQFFEALSWLAQIALFLILGLLVTPHELWPLIVPSVAVATVLILVSRPVAAFACLIPFRFTPRETAFASWVGLRGAVPIYLTVIPVLEGVQHGPVLFGAAFVLVIVSLLVQGWTIGPAARLLGFGPADD